MRKTINTQETISTLEQLIPQYATNKVELDSYKALCDKENAEIKRLMVEQGLQEKTAGNYVAKCSTSSREMVNEDKMLELLKADWVKRNGSLECPYIKTKEYIDMDVLEAALYNCTIPEEVVVSLDTCREVKEVTSLRVSLVKNKEDK
jgi:hypothetical protein